MTTAAIVLALVVATFFYVAIRHHRWFLAPPRVDWPRYGYWYAGEFVTAESLIIRNPFVRKGEVYIFDKTLLQSRDPLLYPAGGFEIEIEPGNYEDFIRYRVEEMWALRMRLPVPNEFIKITVV